MHAHTSVLLCSVPVSYTHLNGIVLIDYITLCRERGQAVLHSVVTAGRSRLRPVLMTKMCIRDRERPELTRSEKLSSTMPEVPVSYTHLQMTVIICFIILFFVIILFIPFVVNNSTAARMIRSLSSTPVSYTHLQHQHRAANRTS